MYEIGAVRLIRQTTIGAVRPHRMAPFFPPMPIPNEAKPVLYTGEMAESVLRFWQLSLPDFPSLTEEERALCGRSSIEVACRRGDTVARASETADHAWLIVEGHVRLLRQTRDGRTLAVELLGPGEIVGEMAILTGEPIPEEAEAIDDALLAKVPVTLLRGICRENGQAGLHFAERVGRRRARIEARFAEFAFTKVPTRIARLLAQLAERFGEGEVDSPRLRLRLTHQEIGEFAGCSRESATRAIDDLIDRGAIHYEDGKIRITSLPLLLSGE